MKINELLEAAPAAKMKLTHGANYRPRYDDNKKMALGSVADWLTTMEINQQHIEAAVEIFKDSAAFKSVASKKNIKYVPSATSEKNGTFTFKTNRRNPNGRPFDSQYKIYANGQIRYVSTSPFNTEHMTRLQAPKPRMTAGDPVGSLVKIWTAALEEMLSKWEQAQVKEVKALKDFDAKQRGEK